MYDATRLVIQPVSNDRVRSTTTRDSIHVTETVHVRERVKAYKQRAKTNADNIDAYWADWEDLQDDMMNFGGAAMSKNNLPGTHKLEVIMTEDFIEKMKRVTRDHQRACDDILREFQTIDDALMTELRELEEVSQAQSSRRSSLNQLLTDTSCQDFEEEVRNTKAMFFESLI